MGAGFSAAFLGSSSSETSLLLSTTTTTTTSSSSSSYHHQSSPSPSLNDVPENCVASIIMHLDPLEICKLALLSKTFHRASSADFVWEAKLPSNYKYLLNNIIALNHPHDDHNLTYKQLYATLSQPNRFHNSTKEIWLDKRSGKVCMCISAKAMKITGIDDRRYWNHIPTDESRFQTVAYLQQTWWFEATGELEFEFPKGSYSLYFRLQLGKASKRFGRRICNLEQVHGWDIKPVRFQLSTSNGHKAVSECCLHDPGTWVLYHVGDFAVDNSQAPTKIKFSIMQIDCTHTKGGLCVDSLFIYPTEFSKI